MYGIYSKLAFQVQKSAVPRWYALNFKYISIAWKAFIYEKQFCLFKFSVSYSMSQKCEQSPPTGCSCSLVWENLHLFHSIQAQKFMPTYKRKNSHSKSLSDFFFKRPCFDGMWSFQSMLPLLRLFRINPLKDIKNGRRIQMFIVIADLDTRH